MSRAASLSGAIFGFVLAMGANAAHADDSHSGDSNADAGPGFKQVVEHAKGVVIRVPATATKENTSASEIRVYDGNTSVTDTSNLQKIWESSIDANSQPRVTNRDISADSSTWGWYNYPGYGGGYGGGWQNYGWQNYGGYYGQSYGAYASYNPCYYGGGAYYNSYGAAYYGTSYGYGGGGGYYGGYAGGYSGGYGSNAYNYYYYPQY